MLTLIIGGAGSGKSEYGEKICKEISKGKMAYIATMMPFGEESLKKIQRHRKMRQGKGFETIEEYTDIGSIKIKGYDTIFIECISNLTANVMFSRNDILKENSGEFILKGIKKLIPQVKNIVIISNDIFSDGIQYDVDTMEYIKQIGIINRELAEIADNVIEVVCGIDIRIK